MRFTEFFCLVLAVAPSLWAQPQESAPAGLSQRDKAEALAKEGRLDQAAVLLRQALETEPKSKGLLYDLGTLERRRGKIKESGEVFLRLLELSPDSGDALEGLSLACLRLGEYDQARLYLERWSAKSPDSPYILGLLRRAYAGLDKIEDAMRVDAEIIKADPLDRSVRHRLDGLRRERSQGIFPYSKSYKSAAPEGLGTQSVQRIIYQGRSIGVEARVRLKGALNLTGGAESREEAQRNDNRGFTYFDILDRYSHAGLEVRPDEDFFWDFQYGRSQFADIEESAVGNEPFGRMRFSGKARAWGDDFKISAERAPKLLRGAGGDRFFSILREDSIAAQADASLGDWDWTGRGAFERYSEGTNFGGYSLIGNKEFGKNFLQPRLSYSQQEFFGAGPDRRLAYVGFDRAALSYRRVDDEKYRLGVSYAFNRFRDGNQLQDFDAELTGWLPRVKELWATYRYSSLDYFKFMDGYRNTDERAHRLGAWWRRGFGPGLWTIVGYEHGFVYDPFRQNYESRAWTGNIEWHHEDVVSLELEARVANSTVNDESRSARMAARYSF